MLVGVGMLSEPLAFAYAGWIGGTTLIVLYGVIACYTYVRITLSGADLTSNSALGPRS